MIRSFGALACALTLLVSAATGNAAPPPAQSLDSWLGAVERIVPKTAADFEKVDIASLKEASSAVDYWASELVVKPGTPEKDVVPAITALLIAKERVDNVFQATLAVRGKFAPLVAKGLPRDALRNYLTVTSALIDLSGRLRYTQAEALDGAWGRLANRVDLRSQLIDLLIEDHSTIGAAIATRELFVAPAAATQPEPPKRGLFGRRPPEQPPAPSTALHGKTLKLIAVAGQNSVLPQLARYINAPATPPALKIAAADTVRQVGLPQDPRPGQSAELPLAPITAATLQGALKNLDPARLSHADAALRNDLLRWLDGRRRSGLTEESYRLSGFDVRPGDWLLMRNPSPYNLFTDLSPGLFTHVGIVALETSKDGKRRMVVVDLPERGSKMPATNVEVYIERTLHCMFLRHPDRKVAEAMGKAAAAVIDNETQFDLHFETARVEALKGKPLRGQKINTYCAGLLLLCANETAAPRSDFFPIPEYPAPGNTVENLDKLGLSIGKDFVSPTGALFSSKLQIVGRREPMYDPRREVEEAIFDHFAESLRDKTLELTPTASQALRLKLAEMAKTNPLLAKAIATANDVSADLDLVSAAKAAAVIESLDDIAYSHSEALLDSLDAFRAGPIETLARDDYTPEEIELVKKYRAIHAPFYQKWVRKQITQRQMRITLVEHYINRGRQAIDERFFGGKHP